MNVISKHIKKMSPILDSMEPLVLIDIMNGFFTWYYLSLRKYNRESKLDKDTVLEVNDKIGLSALKAIFESTFRSRFNTIIKHCDTSINNVIMTFDCPRSKIWRNDYTYDNVSKKSTYNAKRKIN